MEKVVSAGIIIQKNGLFLLGHCTEQTNWDIPKGRMEPGESTIQTAIRECQEETGVIVSEKDLVNLGRFKYSRQKDLHLFKLTVEGPSLSTMKCTATLLSNKSGLIIPEMDRFEYVPFERVLPRVGKSMREVLTILKDEGLI